MMVMHSLGLLQVLVRQMKPGAAHQNAEVSIIQIEHMTLVLYHTLTLII